jgi:hypothetical protein
MSQRPCNNAKRPSFADVKAAALKDIDRVLSHWLPNGKRVDGGKEYTAPNPTRSDKRAGSLKISLSKGTWSDFATGDKGGDLIDLVRYLDGGTDIEACNKLAELLNVSPGAAQAKTAPAKTKAPEWIAIQPIPADPSRGHEQVPSQTSQSWCAVQGLGLSRHKGSAFNGALPLRPRPR